MTQPFSPSGMPNIMSTIAGSDSRHTPILSTEKGHRNTLCIGHLYGDVRQGREGVTDQPTATSPPVATHVGDGGQRIPRLVGVCHHPRIHRDGRGAFATH